MAHLHLHVFLFLFISLHISSIHADSIHGCGGFVEANRALIKARKPSDAKLDYSHITVELQTVDGLVKDRTQCAPNGYYFMPVYDKGSFIIKVKGPEGWSWNPDKAPVVIDHAGCNANEDINFRFTGFSLSGKIIGAVGGESCPSKTGGPAGVSVELLSSTDEVISSVLTSSSGDYSFKNVIPGPFPSFLDGACTDSFKSSRNCFQRYVSDLYFKKHGKLVDSDFKDFLAHELNLASSQSLMRVAHLQRDLIGEGSHRHLCSSISFKIQPGITDLSSTSVCEVTIIERLPSGVFADPFELDHVVHRGVFKDAAVFGDTNLELPSFVSNQSVVEIQMRAAIDFSIVHDNSLELKIEIPVHARYQPLSESGYTRVRFGAPDLILRCIAEGRSDSESCSMTSIARDTDTDSRPVEWNIPSGTKAHGLVVSILTFCSAFLAAVLIIAASLHNSDARLRQTSKQA